MNKLKSFLQVKLETADKIREELEATNHPISMHKQAIEILKRMENNFDKALGNDPNDRFDADAEKYRITTKFQKKRWDYYEKARALAGKLSVKTALWEYANKKLGKSYLDKKEADTLTRELIATQHQSYMDVAADLFKDGKLDWEQHIKLENTMPFVKNELNEVAKRLGIKSISMAKDYNYNYEDIFFSLPKIEEAILRAKNKYNGGVFQNLQIVLQKQGLNGMISADGLVYTLDQNLVVAIDYTENADEIAEDIGKGIYQHFNLHTGKENKLNDELQSIAKSFRIFGLSFSKGIGELDKIFYKLQNIENALSHLTEDEIKKLGNIPILLDRKRPKSYLSKDGLAYADKFTVVIDYNAAPVEIVSMIRTGLKSYKISQILKQDSSPRISHFLQDPSVKNIFDINITVLNLTPREKRELELRIARNLYIQGQKITPENVAKEYNAIIAARQQYRNIPLFTGRNVVAVAHNEILGDHMEKSANKFLDNFVAEMKAEVKKDMIDNGIPYTQKEFEQRFGKAMGGKTLKDILKEFKKVINEYNMKEHDMKEALFFKKAVIDSIKKQGGKLEKVIRAKKALSSLSAARDEIVSKISETPPPFTFIFSGHGHENGIALADSPLAIFSSKQIAECIIKRYENFPELKNGSQNMQDIFIFSSCFSHNFLRNIYQELRRQIGDKKYKLPIICSSSEFGQTSYGDPRNKYEGLFFDSVLDLKSGKKSTLGTIMDKEYLGDSNPSLFIPTDNVKIRQISSRESDTKQDRMSA